MGDTTQVLNIIRTILQTHLDSPHALDEYRIQTSVLIGRNSGRPIMHGEVPAGSDEPGGILLTMRSGDEYELTIK